MWIVIGETAINLAQVQTLHLTEDGTVLISFPPTGMTGDTLRFKAEEVLNAMERLSEDRLGSLWHFKEALRVYHENHKR